MQHFRSSMKAAGFTLSGHEPGSKSLDESLDIFRDSDRMGNVRLDDEEKGHPIFTPFRSPSHD